MIKDFALRVLWGAPVIFGLVAVVLVFNRWPMVAAVAVIITACWAVGLVIRG